MVGEQLSEERRTRGRGRLGAYCVPTGLMGGGCVFLTGIWSLRDFCILVVLLLPVFSPYGTKMGWLFFLPLYSPYGNYVWWLCFLPLFSPYGTSSKAIIRQFMAKISKHQIPSSNFPEFLKNPRPHLQIL